MQNILGYTNRLSVIAGERINFMISVDGYDTYDVQIVRIINGDANPEGPGFKSVRIDAECNGKKKGKRQEIQVGSYAIVPHTMPLKEVAEISIGAMIWPTTPDKGEQIIIDRTSNNRNGGFRFQINENASVTMTLWDAEGQRIDVEAGKPLRKKKWYFVGASIDEHGTVNVFQRPLVRQCGIDDDAHTTTIVRDARLASGAGPESEIFIAAGRKLNTSRAKEIYGHYNGKIDRPRIMKQALEEEAIKSFVMGSTLNPSQNSLIAAWDFSCDISSDRITDLSPYNMHGITKNLPARGVTGFNWNGGEYNWRYALDQYGAIHFHDDDLYDACWEISFSWEVPQAVSSGIYAAEITAGDKTEYIVFFVRPALGNPSAKICLLIPTASYLAYGNEHMALDAPLVQLLSGRLTVLDEHYMTLNMRPDLGLSCYDTHSDGSGVFYSSYLRPLLNMRPKTTAVLGGFGSSLWQFNADTHITDWLEHVGYSYDIITDEDLHSEGLALIENYKVVLTGTHPEYYSTNMWDTLYSFSQRGGRIMYLGGNGFYWRIAYSASYPGAIELRRAEDGTRTWACEPGEYYHSFTGEYGGLWRRLGRPPQMLVGVGFIAQGFDISSSYRRDSRSVNNDTAFIFEGVEDEIIGNFGLIGGGAAGLELDHADMELGTPPNANILASSFNHTDIYRIVTEEILTSHPGTGGKDSQRVRAQVVYFETPEGGAVFSTGSIAWCGSLSYNNYNNNISRITKNVLNRFIQ